MIPQHEEDKFKALKNECENAIIKAIKDFVIKSTYVSVLETGFKGEMQTEDELYSYDVTIKMVEPVNADDAE